MAVIVEPSKVRGYSCHILGSTPDAPGHMASRRLAASVGVGTFRLQRPSIRVGLSTQHPILSASFDERWKACRRRPHLYDGLLAQARNLLGSPPPAPRPRR